MKLADLPEFARPFKKKGFDISLCKNRYQLFKISSRRVEGKSYPVTTRTYIGTIDPVKGLIPKRGSSVSQSQDEFVEYGLSAFICSQFKRKVMRSIYGSYTSVFYMGLLLFMYGHVEERFLKLTYIRNYLPQLPELSGPNALSRVKKASDKIRACLETMFFEQSDLDYVCASLRTITVSAAASSAPHIDYPSELKAVFDKYGVKYE